jgi:hypothetical protein
VSTVEQKGVTQLLHDFGFERACQALGHFFAAEGTLAAAAHLHKFVCFDSDAYGGNDAVGEALFTQLDDGLEMVPQRAQVPSLFAAELSLVFCWRCCHLLCLSLWAANYIARPLAHSTIFK